MDVLVPSDDAICAAVANHLKKMTGVQVPYDAWNIENLSDHLLMNFRVVNQDGGVIEEGRDLQTIKNRLGAGSETAATDTADVVENNIDYGQDDITASVLDDMDKTVELDLQGITIKAYPALVKHGKKVNLRALENKQVAAEETNKALRQLFINAMPEQMKHLRNTIPDIQNLCLKYTDFGRCDDLKQEIINKTIDDIFLRDSIKTEEGFNLQLEKGRSELNENAKRWSILLSTILDEYRLIKKVMKKPLLTQLDMVSDIQSQLNHLFPENFITNIDQQWLQQYPRYLTGIKKRYEKSQSEFSRLWDEYFKRHESLVKQHIDSDELNHYRWMLEEYRVSLFAQELKTKFPISEKRLKKYWNDLTGI
jgi:ATP-dependent helicase HrpA